MVKTLESISNHVLGILCIGMTIIARGNYRERTNNGEEKDPIKDPVIKKEPSWSEGMAKGWESTIRDCCLELSHMAAHTHDRKMVFLHCKGCSPQLNLPLPDLPKGGVLLIKKGYTHLANCLSQIFCQLTS